MADSDLANLRKQCLASLYLCADSVSKYLDDAMEAEFTKLKSYVEKYCLLEAQEEVATQALEKAKKETDLSNVDMLQDRFESHLDSLTGKRLNVNNHPYMRELTKRYQTRLQTTSQNLDESDLAITEQQDQLIDPITKRVIVDPVKNTVCGHIYERDAILNLIYMKNRTKCPVAGCGNRGPILQEHLLSDEELKFRMTISQHSTVLHQRSITDLDDSVE